MTLSASNKALLLMVAICAYAFGIMLHLNNRTDADRVDTAALLTAKLIVSDRNKESSSLVSEHLDKLTLVNFWASWCAPCRDEMPLFETLYRMHKTSGFTIIGIAIDSPSKAQPMLDSMDISYPILYAEKQGMKLMASTNNHNGLLPYSILLDSSGKTLEVKLGKIDEPLLASWLQKYL